MTYQDRYNLWIQNGGDPASAAIAAAISMAENAAGSLGPNPDSGCAQVSDCTGPNGCFSVGLWQINCANIQGLINGGVIKSVDDLTNAATNAAAAIFISGNGHNFDPWTTFKNGVYKSFLPPGTPDVPALPAGESAASTVLGHPIADAITGFASKTVSMVLVGATAIVFLLIGGIWLASSTSAGQTTIKLAKQTATKAAATAMVS